MLHCQQEQVPGDPQHILYQLKDVLKRLGSVLGQNDSQDPLLQSGVPKQNAEAGLPAQVNATRETPSAHVSSPTSGERGSGQPCNDQEETTHEDTRQSKYQRVRCTRNERGAVLWRTKQSYPGHKCSTWLCFHTEAEAAHASDVVVLQHAVTHKERGAELIGQLNFDLGHYILAGTADVEALAVHVLDALMRTAKLSAKSRERVVGAYAAFCSKRNAPRISSSLGDPTPCAVVHPRNGLAGKLVECTWQDESDPSSASGMSDLPKGVVGATESQHFCRTPTSAQPDPQQAQAGLHGLAPDAADETDAAGEGAAREDEQEQNEHQMSASSHRSESEMSEGPTTGLSMSGQPDSSVEQHAQRQDGPSGHESLKPDSVPAEAACGDFERAIGSDQQDIRGASSAADEGSLSGAPQPQGSPAIVADTVIPGSMAEPPPAAEAASSHSLDQQSMSSSQGREREPVARATPPPPSASLLDVSPMWPPGIAMREPDSGEQEPLIHAAPGVPPQQQGLAQPAPPTIESCSLSSGTSSSSSDDMKGTANEPVGQPASEMHPSWGAPNGHGRAGIGEGTEADPVVLSSDSEEEGQGDDGMKQGAKRQRTEERPDHGFIKPEKAPPREQPTLAQLLQQYTGAQARPGSLRRPSLPIFESLRRPTSSREEGMGPAHQSASGSTPVRQDVPSWMRVRRTIHGASQGTLPGKPDSAARTPNSSANQRPHAPPISPFTPSSNAKMPATQQRFPAASAPPFSGKPFSTFRQAPAQPSAQPPRPHQAAESGRHAQPGSQAGIPAGLRHREVPGAAQRHPTCVEFIDLDSTSGESEDVSWNEEAESQPAVSADGPSPHPTPEPSHNGDANAADAQAGAEGGHEASAPLAHAPEPEDMSGLVIERDRSAMAAVEAKEWEQRRVEIERQAELARREKKRRRAESEIAQRSQARLEDHRRLLAAQESEQDERERLRMEVRALLESRIRFARSAESTLRALSIPMEYDPVTRAPNIIKAVRRALRFYHPDRYQSAGLRAQVEAEEMFKLVSRVQNP